MVLVQLNGDTCHVPLPRERHLGVLPEGDTNRTTCRRIRQLEVCQLLQLDLQVIYLHPDNQPHQGHSAKTGKRGQHDHGSEGPSVSGDVGHIWSCVRKLDPKRPNPMVVLTPPPNKLRDPSGLGWHIMPGEHPRWCWDGWDGRSPLEEIPTVTSPTAKTPGSSGSAPPTVASYFWEVANKTPGELLATKSSIDACHQKLVWELGMSLCQNNSKTTESIREAKAICTHSTQEAKTLCSTSIKEAKATCIHST